MFNFIRNYLVVSQGVCDTLTLLLCMRVLVAPHVYQNLVVFNFLILSILVDVWWYLVVLICASQMTVLHAIICLLVV